jgi:hypothetical protein
LEATKVIQVIDNRKKKLVFVQLKAAAYVLTDYLSKQNKNTIFFVIKIKSFFFALLKKG